MSSVQLQYNLNLALKSPVAVLLLISKQKSTFNNNSPRNSLSFSAIHFFSLLLWCFFNFRISCVLSCRSPLKNNKSSNCEITNQSNLRFTIALECDTVLVSLKTIFRRANFFAINHNYFMLDPSLAHSQDKVNRIG